MNAPKRLLDTNEVSEQLRADLKQAAEPVPFDQNRVFLSFQAALDGRAEFDPSTEAHPDHAGLPESAASRMEASRSEHQIGPRSPAGIETARSLAGQLAQGSYWGWSATGVAAALLVGGAVFWGTGALRDQGRISPVLGSHQDPAPVTRESTPPFVDQSSPQEPPPGNESFARELVRQGSGLAPASPEPERSGKNVMGSPERGAGSPDLRRKTSRSTEVDLSAERRTSSSRPATAPSGPLPGASAGLDASTLKEEVEELRRMNLLLQTEPARVLVLLQQSPFRERGKLEQERQVLEIEALSRLGQQQKAQAFARAFRERYPGSLSDQRVACIAEPGLEPCR